jgi:uncharacterized protein (DUF885 family)
MSAGRNVAATAGALGLALSCLALSSLALSSPGSSAQAAALDSPHQRLADLARELTDTMAHLHPMQATQLGIAGMDGELETPSEAARTAEIAQIRAWQRSLRSIVAGFGDSTTLTDRDDARLLAAQLTQQLDGLLVYQFDRKDYSAPANGLVQAIFVQFLHLPVAGKEGASDEDVAGGWRDIIARLEKAPGYIAAAERMVTTPGHLFGIVGSQELAGAPDFFNGALTDAASSQLGADSQQFARFLRARDATLTAIAAAKTYIDSHVASWPENFAIGRQAYDHMLREEQLLPFDSNDVERMGEDELAHGWAEEAWLTSLSQRDSIAFGAASGGGMAPSGAALIDYYRDRIAELRQFVVDHDVVTIPAWLGSMQVLATPSFLQPVLPGASMNPPRLFSASTTGFYFITPPTSLDEAAARLDMNQDFDRDRILSTAAHEAMPGHFLQLSIAKRNPDFVRKIQNSATFQEGWAFYGEEMFVRLGLYGGDLDGRLFTARWERVRGARAIVDPKLASGEWSYDQAVEFFAKQTRYSKEAAQAAVAGIATGPGYVIAYTVGRQQLELLLGQYQLRMGDRGSLHDFHDRLLCYGSVPFSILAPELLADLDKPASVVRATANY